MIREHIVSSDLPSSIKDSNLPATLAIFDHSSVVNDSNDLGGKGTSKYVKLLESEVGPSKGKADDVGEVERKEGVR